LGRKSKELLAKEDYVKANIKSEISHALRLIEETIGVTKTDVVRFALYEYIVRNYPNFLPKSEGEIIMKVKEKLQTQKFLNESNLDDFTAKSLIGYEDELKEQEEQQNVIERKINTLSQKLKQDYPNKEEKLKLLENKKELEGEKDLILQQINDTKRFMNDTKRRKRYLSKEETYKII
jgi:hypothetical protein